MQSIPLPTDLAAEAPDGPTERPGDPIFSNCSDNQLELRVRSHPDVAEITTLVSSAVSVIVTGRPSAVGYGDG